MLIRELLSKGGEQLGRERGTRENVRAEDSHKNNVRALETELVLAYVLGMSREELVAHDDMDVTSELSLKLFYKYLDELKDGKPLAYILKSKEFYGMDFYVDERVLVPRPETEMLVDGVLQYLNERTFVDDSHASRIVEGAESVYDSVDLGRDFRVLDIGTGSGCVISAILHNFDNSVGIACDISTDALEVARENLTYHGLEDRCELVESDLLSAFDDGEMFDVIVTNPPYVAEISGSGNFTADENVARWEPSGALYAGPDGMDVYKKLVQQLVEKGIEFNLLVGEFGIGQKDAVLELLNKNFIQCVAEDGSDCCSRDCDTRFELEIKNDLAGIPRIFIVRKVE